MTVTIPKWVMIRYSALYRDFKCKSFTRENAKEVFQKYNLKSEEKLANVFFSELNKKGWVIVERNKKDSRKKLFRLINPEQAILDLELKED